MKAKFSVLTLVLFVAAGVAIGLMTTPDKVDADQCFPCSWGTPITTQVVTVTDVDCMWSEMKARNQLNLAMICPDGYCLKEIITTEACHYVGYNQWRVSMKGRYQCKDCFGIPDF